MDAPSKITHEAEAELLQKVWDEHGHSFDLLACGNQRDTVDKLYHFLLPLFRSKTTHALHKGVVKEWLKTAMSKDPILMKHHPHRKQEKIKKEKSGDETDIAAKFGKDPPWTVVCIAAELRYSLKLGRLVYLF